MLESIVIYSLFVFIAFYLFNHSDIFAGFRDWVLVRVPWWTGYSLTCAFCTTFWITLPLVVFAGFNPLHFAATPLVLLINLTFIRLCDKDNL